MSTDVEPNKYTLRMWSKVKAKELHEYEVYAFSQEEAIQKLKQGDHQGILTPVDFEVLDIEEFLPDTVEIVSCEQGTVS